MFIEYVNKKHILYTAWCNEEKCEKDIKAKSTKDDTGETISGYAKTLNIPFE